MSSLYGSNSVMLYKQYVAFDDKLKELFAGKLDEDIVNNIYQPAYRKYVSKRTDIDINRTFNTALNKFEYDITMTMKYTYFDVTNVAEAVETRYIEDITFSATEAHNMFLICPVFDLYTYDPQLYGNSYCTDLIDIEYVFSDDYVNVVNFYIAEQNSKNQRAEYASYNQKIDPMNVRVNTCALSTFRVNNNTQDPYLKLYTNVGVLTDSITDSTDLTYIAENTGNELYTMTVKVKLDDKVVADFTSAKAN